MNGNSEYELEVAWKRVGERLAALQRRHYERKDIPFYEAALNAPATERDLSQLETALGMAVPLELGYSLKRWNGRWIAQDHMISLMSIAEHLQVARANPWREEHADLTFERVVGPINPVLNSKKRICFGGHEATGSFLFIDYENPPAGGQLGQVIRLTEEPVAQFVAATFVDFLNLIVDAPVYDDDPDFDPLAWRP